MTASLAGSASPPGLSLPGWRATVIERAIDAVDDDALLVVAARHGDDEAFDELVRRHAARLHAVARRLVGEDAAHDAVQDCLWAAYRGLARFRGEARFSTYLHGILVHQCRRVLQRRRRWQPWPTAEPASALPGPDEIAERSDLRRRLDVAVAGLPPRLREVVVLREAAGFAYDDIARALSLPVGTVRSRIARARTRLRILLERDGVGP